MAKEDVVFKGTKDGISIRLNDQQPFEVLKKGLVRRLKAAERFFKGATVTLDAGSTDLGHGRLQELEELITDRFGLHLVRVITTPTPRHAHAEADIKVVNGHTAVAESKGLSDEALRAAASSVFQGPSAHTIDPVETAENDTLLIKRTIRSGQRVRYNGNVVILGDVNPGAEVVARGDVLVMGRLRGMVHAGATGDDKAIVAAVRLQPTQLRISRHITRPPEGEGAKVNPTGPEVAVIRDGGVVIDSYLSYDGRRGLVEFFNLLDHPGGLKHEGGNQFG